MASQNRQDRMKTLLENEFSPEFLDVINQSHLHAGHAGDDGTGETHYKIIITADSLKTLSRVEQHRKINQALAAEFAAGLHALSLKVNNK